MKINFLSRHCFKISLLAINLFCSFVFGREYVLEVSPAPNGFQITTNIPRSEDPRPTTISCDDPHYDDPIPTITFVAQSQNFLLIEKCLEQDAKTLSPLNRIEIFLDNNGHIHVKQLSMIDDLKIKNSTKDGTIIFEDTKQHATYVTLESKNFCNKTDLFFYDLTGSFSGSFINNNSLQLGKSRLTAHNLTNNNQIIVHYKVYNIWTIRDVFQNNTRITGNGSLTVRTQKFLNDTHAVIDLNGTLEILPSQLVNNTKHCSWSCNLDYFPQGTTRCLAFGGEWCTGFLGGSEQERCLQLKDNAYKKFNQQHECNEILLLGSINADSMNVEAQNITFKARIDIQKNCAIKPHYVFVNSGMLYVKGSFDLKEGEFFYNDARSVISIGKSATFNAIKIANISGAISAQDITLTADKLINARGALTGVKEGEPDKPQFHYHQYETYPLGYITARNGNIKIDVNEFYQDASFLGANKSILINTKNKFSNLARETKTAKNKVIKQERSEFCFLYCPDNVYETYGIEKKIGYEPSTIAAGNNVSIIINQEKINFNESHHKIRTTTNFHNTGTIQGVQLVELDANDKDKIVNGFTHKAIPASFAYLTLASDLHDDKTVQEYEHKQNGVYYYTHPLFNENKPLKSIQELAIVANSIQQDTPSLMSPLVEAMSLEFVLHKLAGRTRITGSQDCFDQLHELQMQGLIYAIVYGTLKPVGAVETAKNNPHIPYPLHKRRPKDKRIKIQSSDSKEPEAENERKKIVLSPEERAQYQKLIESVKGNISPEEYVRRLNALKAKTHVAVLTNGQIENAPASFMYYKVENYNGKDYLHPYFHADEDSFERLRRADGSIQGGNVKVNGGNLQNFGLIKADKELLIKVASFLNEKPIHERLDGIYKIVEVKPGGETTGEKVNITTTEKDITNKGGTIKSTNGDTTLKTEKGSINLLSQTQTNQNSADKALEHVQATVSAQGGSLNMDSGKSINVEGTAQSATKDINKTAKESITEKTLIDVHQVEETLPDGTRHVVEVPTVVPTTNVAGNEIHRTTSETLADTGVVNFSGGDQVNKAKTIISKPATAQQSETESKSQCSWFGCSGRERQTLRTLIQQSQYTSLTGSVINSSDLDTTLEGVVIVAGQKVRLVAGKKLTVKGAKEKKSTTESGWSFGVSFLGSDVIQSAAQGDYSGAAIQLAQTSKLATSLLALMENAKNKGSAGDVITNIEYAGIEAVREFVALSKTPAGSGLKGGAGVIGQQALNAALQVSFNLGFYDKKANNFSTTSSSINCARWEIEAPETELRDGVQAQGDELSIKGDQLTITAAESGQTSSNMAAGVFASVGVGGIGVGAQGSAGKSEEKTYTNADLEFKHQEYDVRTIDAQGANVHGKTADFKDVKTVNIASVQDTKQANQNGGSASASTSGAMGGSFSHENQDKQNVKQRSGFTFTEPVKGSVNEVHLTGADFTGGQGSTVKIDQMQGHDLKDHDHATNIGLAAGYNPGDPVPFTAEPNVKVDKDGGTQHAYSNLNANQKSNTVDDPSKVYEQTENTHWHVRFVLATLDMKQIKEAEHKMQSLFDSKKKLRVKDMQDVVAMYGMSDAKDEILRDKAARDNTHRDQTPSDDQAGNHQQEKSDEKHNADKQEPNDKFENVDQQANTSDDDDLEVFDEDEMPGKQNEDACFKQKEKQHKPMGTQKTNPSKADSEKQKLLHKLNSFKPERHTHKTKSGKPIIIDVVEYKDNNQPFEAINIEDHESDTKNNIDTITLKNNRYAITITGEKDAFVDMLLDRQTLIANLIAQSGAPHAEPVTVDEHHTLKVIASILLDFVPGLGNAKMGTEALRGVDFVTGEPLTGWQRALCALGAAAPLIMKGGKLVYQGLRGLNGAAEAVNDLSKATKAAEAASEIGKAGAEGTTKVLSRSEMIQEIEKIIKPNGELIGIKVQSNEHVVRQINVAPEKGKELFYKLVESCGAKNKIIPHQKPDLAAAGGLMAKIDKGFTISWRPFSSTESASVDIHITELEGVIEKFKFPGN